MATTLTPPLAAPATPTAQAAPQAYSTHRKIAEVGAVLTGLVAVITLTPLNHPDYLIPVITACAGVAVYALYGLWRIPNAARRWGLIGNPKRAEGAAWGAVWTIIIVLGSAAPVLALKLVIPRPPLATAQGYLFWCFIQDFVFFSLLLRNLLDFFPKHTAVWVSAALFGVSHYPFGMFMLATGLTAVWWGYMFASTRVLWYVTLPHALLGLMLLG